MASGKDGWPAEPAGSQGAGADAGDGADSVVAWDAVSGEPAADDATVATVWPGGSAARAEFEEFFETFHRELARFAYFLIGDHDAADDITAEALTSAWKNWDRVRAAEDRLAYVRRAVANLAKSRMRTAVRDRARFSLLSRLHPTRQAQDPTDVAAVLDLRSALLRLPMGKRACVVLRYAYGLSEAETAETLGISVGTVKSQTSKGVTQLERLLAGGAVEAMPGADPAGGAGAGAGSRRGGRVSADSATDRGRSGA
ncbi:MAG: SigE family RNA polymerase sigma factor, partial [Frankia sp.]|nr:SigE family RNA polymerase sigma factor [Frankia sp.]